jgi:hypothetical protein
MAGNDSGALVITGAESIEAARLLAVRSALSLNVRTGMKLRGRPARVLANEAMGTSIRTARATYEAFDTWLVARYPGLIKSRPLPEGKGS